MPAFAGTNGHGARRVNDELAADLGVGASVTSLLPVNGLHP